MSPLLKTISLPSRRFSIRTGSSTGVTSQSASIAALEIVPVNKRTIIINVINRLVSVIIEFLST
jgi:hypothetical protein